MPHLHIFVKSEIANTQIIVFPFVHIKKSKTDSLELAAWYTAWHKFLTAALPPKITCTYIGT